MNELRKSVNNFFVRGDKTAGASEAVNSAADHELTSKLPGSGCSVQSSITFGCLNPFTNQIKYSTSAARLDKGISRREARVPEQPALSLPKGQVQS